MSDNSPYIQQLPGGGMAVMNPLGDVIDGMMQGHQMALQMHRQQQADQQFKTQQILENQKVSANDIMAKMQEQQLGRPVINGTVQDQMNATLPGAPMDPGAQGGPQASGDGAPVQGPRPAYNMPAATMPGIPQQSTYMRKPDSSRVTSRKDAQGNTISTEWRTPEEQAGIATQADITQKNKLTDAAEATRIRIAATQRQSELQLTPGGKGIPAAGMEAVGYPAGYPLTRTEFNDATSELEKRRVANLKIIPKEGTMVDTSVPNGTQPAAAPGAPAPVGAPGAPQLPAFPVVGQGAPKDKVGEYERTFEPAFALKHGLTVDGLHKNADLTMQAVQEFAQKSKDPETTRLAHALTQAHLDDLAAKRNTVSQPIEQGTREFKVAQDLAYGRLTLQQFRGLYSSRNQEGNNKKLDIYDKAAELNPNFNPAQFEMGFKFASNPKVQQQLASMDNVKQGVNDLLKFSDAAERSGSPLLNKYVQKGGIAIGGKTYSDFHTAQIGFADELSGALGFGGATDMSKQMGLDMTNANLSPANFRSAIQNVVIPFIDRKRDSTLKQMGVYGQQGMNPSAGAATVKMQSPDGKQQFDVPADQVDHYTQKGAKRVGQ